MSSITPHPARHDITLPQLLALMIVWSGVIYGVTHQTAPETERLSWRDRSALATCAPNG